ncbi:Clp protease ClpP [Flavobacteriales bacterium]|nr:Clp protease ClpP [Flavobacteriales bacterium]
MENPAHIYIYGEIISFQDSNIDDYGCVNLKSIKNQIDQQPENDGIVAHIHSIGGDVDEGFAIYDYLKSLGKSITTIIEGNCYSIATIIALAGDERLMTSNSEFMIHNPWGGTYGDKEDILKYANLLDKVENKIADFYAKKTGADKDTLLALMKDETFMTPEKAVDLKFITSVLDTIKAVAKIKTNKEIINNKDTSIMNKILKELAEIKNVFQKKEVKTEIKNIDVTLAEGGVATTDSEVLTVGDEIKDEDGNYLPDGDHLLSDERTIVVLSGRITEIREKEEEQEQETVDNKESEENKEVVNQMVNLIKEMSQEIVALKKDIQATDKKYLSLANNIKSKPLEDLKTEEKQDEGSDFKQDILNKLNK